MLIREGEEQSGGRKMDSQVLEETRWRGSEKTYYCQGSSGYTGTLDRSQAQTL